MTDLFNNHSANVTFILISLIIKKIRKTENCNTDEEITAETINRYLPEIEKHIPDIKKQLPDVIRYCHNRYDNKCKSDDHHKSDNKCNKHEYNNDDNFSKIYNHHLCGKCSRCKKLEKEDGCIKHNIHKEKHHHNHDCECLKIKKSEHSSKCESESSSSDEYNCTQCYQDTDIHDHVKKIKSQLDRIYESDKDDEKNDNDFEYIKHLSDVKISKVSDEEENSVTEWNLGELKKNSCKPYSHECGKFVIDEDLNQFKCKVLRKAELIISCYKNKLDECNEKIQFLQCQLKKCRDENEKLHNSNKHCHKMLKECECEKKQIMKKAKECEKKLLCLIEKYNKLEQDYQHLEKEYQKKKAELKKCQCKNSLLIKEIAELKTEIERLKKELEKCQHEKKCLREEVEKLELALQKCKKEKCELLHVIEKLEEKLKHSEEANEKLQYIIRKLKEENEKLERKVSLLICQNKELEKENADLKCQLGKTLSTLKCLCEKYNALKKKCCKKEHCW